MFIRAFVVIQMFIKKFQTEILVAYVTQMRRLPIVKFSFVFQKILRIRESLSTEMTSVEFSVMALQVLHKIFLFEDLGTQETIQRRIWDFGV